MLVVHRRAGKTVSCIADLVDASLRCQRERPRFAYVAPYRVQAKAVAWDYLKALCAPMPGATVNESELRVDLPNGARVQLFGADNYEALRGQYYDGVVLDEYADMDPRAWTEVIRPALSDRLGWAVFIGTPKGRNGFYDLYQHSLKAADWTGLFLRASQSGLIAPEELQAAREVMTEDQYQQEYECSFEAAIQGAFYAREMESATKAGRITGVPHNTSAEVFTAWDLGIDDATAIWFGQVAGRELHWIDYLEVSGEGLPEIAKRLKADHRGAYDYSDHYLPHDVVARELGTGRSRKETLEALGLRNIITAPQMLIADGINATRSIFAQSWFDKVKCERGLECLTQYRRKWDDKRQVFQERPLHDWTSHGADALRTFATGHDVFKPEPGGSFYKNTGATRTGWMAS